MLRWRSLAGFTSRPTALALCCSSRFRMPLIAGDPSVPTTTPIQHIVGIFAENGLSHQYFASSPMAANRGHRRCQPAR